MDGRTLLTGVLAVGLLYAVLYVLVAFGGAVQQVYATTGAQPSTWQYVTQLAAQWWWALAAVLFLALVAALAYLHQRQV